MAIVKFTANLKRFYPNLTSFETTRDSIPSILNEMEARHPGIRDYIVDEQGRLRKHVNIFIGNALIRDREKLSDALEQNDEVYIMQALSGG